MYTLPARLTGVYYFLSIPLGNCLGSSFTILQVPKLKVKRDVLREGVYEGGGGWGGTWGSPYQDDAFVGRGAASLPTRLLPSLRRGSKKATGMCNHSHQNSLTLM